MELCSLTINGEKHSTAAGATLAALLEALGVRQDNVIVERNGVVVERGRLEAVHLESGDRLEIVRFVAGG